MRREKRGERRKGVVQGTSTLSWKALRRPAKVAEEGKGCITRATGKESGAREENKPSATAKQSFAAAAKEVRVLEWHVMTGSGPRGRN
mmetsp:Transcript_44691/g.71725  ORF Transcript_44691/g.71725 Transcript_44691/m.71725 type:complete len:88 (+) Transcript_44691:166-429(+)